MPRETLKIAKNDVFATFAPKVGLCSLKTAAKVHTELQQGKTSIKNQFPIKKHATEIFFIPYATKLILLDGNLCRLFSQHPDQPERNGLNRQQRQHLLSFSTKSHLFMTSVAEMEKGVGNTSFSSSIARLVHGLFSI